MKFLADFFPVLLFFIAYKLKGIYWATAVAIAASVVQVAYHGWRYRKVQTTHLVTFGVLIVFGGLTLLLQDRTFIMWKPSIVNWLFAAAFLGSQFIGERTLVERMMSHAIEIPPPIWVRLNQFWVLFFISMGAANFYVANGFFIVDAQLRATTGLDHIDLDHCAGQFQGAILTLCNEAHALEAYWVNFKLFGMMGLTIAFVIIQALYLSRYIKDDEVPPEAKA
jgi:intracellular septation protein